MPTNPPNRIRGVAPATLQTAQQMRASMTPAETALWHAIRRKQLNNLRFRAQHPLGQFILDFYCPSAKLCIELDGEHHNLNHAQDAARTAHLNAHDIKVIRFPNHRILSDLPSVLEEIKQAAQKPNLDRNPGIP